MKKPLRLLIVEDSSNDAALLLREVGKAGYAPQETRVETPEALERALGEAPWDLVLCDYSMPHMEAPEAIGIVRRFDADVPILVISGTVGEATAVAVIRLGAQDYILKDNLMRLAISIDRELAEAANRRERRRLEGELEHARKLEAIGRLAGGLAHDFRNMLSVILGYTDLLLARVPPGHPLSADMREIRAAARRGVDLSRQLLAFSRKDTTSRSVFEPNAVIQGFEGMLRRLIGEDVRVVLELSPGVGTVLWDPLALEQALLNFAVNARDAMPRGGLLTIATANVDLTEAAEVRPPTLAPGADVVVAVSDTGCGMDEETRARLFEPFFTTKEQGKGTGLGLAAVHGSVRQAGGDIGVETAPAKGTAFRVFLPRAGAAPPAAGPSAAPEKALGGTETILLVEDEVSVASMIRRALEEAGYRVIAASTPVEMLGMEPSRWAAASLLIADVVMPRMKGTELAERLRAVRPGLKVLFISGYPGDADLEQALSQPGTAYLEKPFSVDSLLRGVRSQLSGRG